MPMLEWVRRQGPRGAMRAPRVVVIAPGFEALTCILETVTRMPVQTFFVQSAVDAFNVGVCHRLAWPDGLPLDARCVRSGFERLADERGPVISVKLA